MARALIELRNVFRQYDIRGESDAIVLENINLTVFEDEFLAILGPSGSGKSTLLRIIAGLVPATIGKVYYLGKSITGVNPGVAMVFQSFALFPWLTVRENVMLGLEGKRLKPAEREEKTLKAIDMVGLDGYENAYPKELSGGMRQRVGLGRALVNDPDVLLMDEPFSALDVLTAENLRRDMLELWLEKKITTKSIIMVTHGIEEAVYMADRALVLSSGPARIIEDIKIELPRWRDKNSPEFSDMVDRLYSIMIKKQTQEAKAETTADTSEWSPVPVVSAGALTGFLELLEDNNEKADLYRLAERFVMEIDDFLPIVEAASLLNLARIVEGDIELTPEGARFARATVLERKELFREQLVKYVPFVNKIVKILDAKSNKQMDIDFFKEMLSHHFSPKETDRQMSIIINWGRYAELFDYDDDSERLFIERDED
ncbi:MAG: nitrate/sulfonate/bicarbonate ABC transporter ATP-binding protein [Negativicutes bacterium]|nr:nitrate/sulfonate/bicarbonate ABC transporter ATP-binding protein [Negativicutes bacterium]